MRTCVYVVSFGMWLPDELVQGQNYCDTGIGGLCKCHSLLRAWFLTNTYYVTSVMVHLECSRKHLREWTAEWGKSLSSFQIKRVDFPLSCALSTQVCKSVYEDVSCLTPIHGGTFIYVVPQHQRLLFPCSFAPLLPWPLPTSSILHRYFALDWPPYCFIHFYLSLSEKSTPQGDLWFVYILHYWRSIVDLLIIASMKSFVRAAYLNFWSFECLSHFATTFIVAESAALWATTANFKEYRHKADSYVLVL